MCLLRLNNNRLAATKSLIPKESDMYPGSSVDKEISVYNFELQLIDTFPGVNNIPVLLFTLTGSSLSSEAKNPAKSASVYKLSCKLTIK